MTYLATSLKLAKFNVTERTAGVVVVTQTACRELSTNVGGQLTAPRQKVDQCQQDSQHVNLTGRSSAIDALEHTTRELTERYTVFMPSMILAMVITKRSRSSTIFPFITSITLSYNE